MIVRILSTLGLSLVAAQAHAGYRCELFDRAENAPGGDIPAKVLFTDSNNFEDAKAACSALVDQRNYVDYWLKWIPAADLPADWKSANLLSQPLVTRTAVDCKGGIFGSGLPFTEDKPLTGGEATIISFYPAVDSDTESMKNLSMRLFVPGFLADNQEYTHSATFTLNEISVLKADFNELMGGRVFVDVTPAPSSTIDIATEGNTEQAKITAVSLQSGGGDYYGVPNSVYVSLTFVPEGGVRRTLSYTVTDKTCVVKW
jgi:hypothetical protein